MLHAVLKKILVWGQVMISERSSSLEWSHFALVSLRWQLTKRSHDRMLRRRLYVIGSPTTAVVQNKEMLVSTLMPQIKNIISLQQKLLWVVSLLWLLTAIIKHGSTEKVNHLTVLYWKKTSHLKSSYWTVVKPCRITLIGHPNKQHTQAL